MPNHHASLWALTSYFNPAHYHTKLRNFKAFHQSLKMPLVIAELIINNQESDLSDYLSSTEDPGNTIHLQIHGNSIMWQKERLLNLALARVPATVDHIAWIDCDILFHNPVWHEKMVEALRTNPLVQGFSRVMHLPPKIDHVPPCLLNLPEDRSFMASRLENIETFKGHGRIWAAQADLLRRHGLYDAMIVGSGDLAMACAVMGNPSGLGSHRTVNGSQKYYSYLTKAHLSHYQAWAEPFHRDLCSQGQAGCLDETIYHLWHGEPDRRQYITRHQMLLDNHFDPATDIALNEEGAWEWSSDKKELHDSVARYFDSRREDDPSH